MDDDGSRPPDDALRAWPPDGEPGIAGHGYVPPDPAEPPPVELSSAVGDLLPWGTMALVLSWGIAFALMTIAHEVGDHAAYVLRGASLPGSLTVEAGVGLLASTFLHSGYRHLLFNGLAMLVFGQAVERVFSRWSFWIAFAWGGAIASLTSLAWRTWRETGSHISIGASGAIFALAGALLAAAWRLRSRLAVGRARALAAAILFFAAPSIVQGFHDLGTDNAAHVGGVVAGLAMGTILPLSPRLGGARVGPGARLAAMLGGLALAIGFARVLVER
jgi:membrane associated rhomboid family serine protease